MTFGEFLIISFDYVDNPAVNPWASPWVDLWVTGDRRAYTNCHLVAFSIMGRITILWESMTILKVSYPSRNRGNQRLRTPDPLFSLLSSYYLQLCEEMWYCIGRSVWRHLKISRQSQMLNTNCSHDCQTFAVFTITCVEVDTNVACTSGVGYNTVWYMCVRHKCQTTESIYMHTHYRVNVLQSYAHGDPPVTHQRRRRGCCMSMLIFYLRILKIMWPKKVNILHCSNLATRYPRN